MDERMHTGTGRVALVAGATGLVGRALTRRLAASAAFEVVVPLVRQPRPRALAGMPVAPRVVDYDRLAEGLEGVAATHVFCALGTTIRKAGSREDFRRVDFDFALAVAEVGIAAGARHFLLVSALGASRTSRIFYNRVKGELEDAVRSLPYRSITIARPSLLLGARDEFRLGERVAQGLGLLVPGRYRPVQADAVAAVLVRAAIDDRAGMHILESREIRALARAIPDALGE